MKRNLGILILGMTILGGQWAHAQNLLQDGDFEAVTVSETVNANVAHDRYEGGETFGGWTVEGGNVDLMASFAAAHGTNCLDLAGTTPGVVYQDVSTVPGQGYKLALALTGNPSSAYWSENPLKQVEVWWDGVKIQTIAASSTNVTETNMNWQAQEILLPAASTNVTRLRLAGISGPETGAVIDNLSLETSEETPPPLPPAPLLADGSFEAVTVSETINAQVSHDRYQSGETFGGWKVDAGNVDLMASFAAAHGTNCLDLAGTVPGAVYQDISTVSGQSYRLTFALTGNPSSAYWSENPVKRVAIWWGGVRVETFSATSEGVTETNMGWQTLEVVLPAASTNVTRLRLVGIGGPETGAVIDDLSLAVSEEAPPLPVALLTDGDFEAVTVSETVNEEVAHDRYDAGETFGAWTVASGNVDLMASFAAAHGTNCVDLTGDQRGAIYQDAQTEVGQVYRLRLALAGNPASAFWEETPVKKVEVWWEGHLIKTLSADSAGTTNTDLKWKYEEVLLPAATTSSSRLLLVSRSGQETGIVLDDVSLTPDSLLQNQEALPGKLHKLAGTSRSAAVKATTSSASLQTVAVGWRMVGLADFNGDEQTDALWQQEATGLLAVAFRTEEGFARLQALKDKLSPLTGWRVAGLGDFNGDGRPDLLWKNVDGRLVTWFLNGLKKTGRADLKRANASWKLSAVADFNRDNSPDFLWRHSDGRVAVWTMHQTNFVSSVRLNGGQAVSKDWRLAGAGDMDQDGQADLVWQHQDGWVSVSLMEGTAVRESFVVNEGRPVSSFWRLSALGDLNQDGWQDFLWRSTGDRLVVWYMDDGEQVESAVIEKKGGGQFGYVLQPTP